MKRITVTLGAGHGGYDFGTVSPSGLAEKSVTLHIARCIRRRLDRAGAFETLLIRPADRYVPTQLRASLIGGLGSDCHVELHADLLGQTPRSAAVWYRDSCAEDARVAVRLSALLAADCGGCADCGARAWRGLPGAPPPGSGASERFENYYRLLEAIPGARHAFYCEIGLPGRPADARRCAQKAARAVARALCALFSVPFPVLCLTPRGAEDFRPDTRMTPVYLGGGLYHIRAGPSGRAARLGVARGMIYTGVYARENGWLRVDPDENVFLTEAAVDDAPGNIAGDDGACSLERMREGEYYVTAGPREGDVLLGTAAGAPLFFTRQVSGRRRIFFCDRFGYVGPEAWR